jgi:tetratricopeptide (TPR) repeat protein
MEQTTSCASCGSKLAVSRERCPKCRALVTPVGVVPNAAHSRRLVRATVGLSAVFGLVLAGLWLTQPGAAEPSVHTAVADPLAARRQPKTLPAAAAPPAGEVERPFLDAADKGSLAYGAGDFASALSRFEEAVRKNPEDAESLSNLGQVLVRMQRPAEALPYFERAAALNPSRWAYRFNLARTLGLLQRWDEAIASYRQAQTLFPDDYATTFNLALALHKKGDDSGAIGEYKKAIALNPEDASFRMALAVSYEGLQQKADAAGQYAEYLRLSPLASDGDKVRAKIAYLTSAPQAPAPPAAPTTGESR